jgi:SSS family solute:Na+ symporter
MAILDWIIVVAYFMVLAFFIFKINRARTVEDFAVGSRQIPKGIIFATLSANFIGPGYSMVMVNNAASTGLIWFFILMAFSIQTVVVGIFIAPKITQFKKAYTIGDVMGYKYGKGVKIFTGLLSFAYCAGVVGLVSKASGEIIHGLTGFPILYTIIFSTAFILFYTTFGGIKSDIILDVIQFIILGIAFPLIIVMMFFKVGPETIISKIPSNLLDVKFTFATFGIMLGFLLGECLVPPYFNRALASKSSNDAKSGFVFSGLFSFAWFFVCVALGLLAAGVVPTDGNVWMTNLKTFAPIGILGLSIAAMFSIIISTQDSFLNCASVSFNKDLLSFVTKSKYNQQLVNYRIVNVLVGIFAVVFAYSIPTLTDAILVCFTLWAPTVVLPLVIGIVKKNVKPISGVLAIFFGIVFTAIWEWVLDNPQGIPSLLIGVIANQIAFWSSELLIKNSPNIKLLNPLKEE